MRSRLVRFSFKWKKFEPNNNGRFNLVWFVDSVWFDFKRIFLHNQNKIKPMKYGLVRIECSVFRSPLYNSPECKNIVHNIVAFLKPLFLSSPNALSMRLPLASKNPFSVFLLPSHPSLMHPFLFVFRFCSSRAFSYSFCRGFSEQR